MGRAATDKAKAVKTGTAAVLGRYLARKKAPPGADPAPVSVPRPTPERAISTAIGRAAQKTCALPSFAVQAKMGRATLSEMIDILPERALILVVENYRGTHGIVALSPGFLSAMIEMQSIGRVFSHQPPERRPTRTDASIAAEFVNAALAELATEFGAFDAANGLAAFRFASFVEDPKPLELMLEDTVYHSIRLDTRLGQGGAREGRFLAFLPSGAADLAALPPGSAPEAVTPKPVTGRSLSGAVLAAPITLNAILCRKTISLRDLRGLVPGALVALPFDAMSRARLEAPSGLVVATGKLGALHGQRAIRIGGQAQPSLAPGGAAVPAAPPPFTVSADNLFDDANDTEVLPATSLFAVEPPLGDLSDPDGFRPENAVPDETSPQSVLALPANFSIE